MFVARRDPGVRVAGFAFTRAPLDLGDRQPPGARTEAFGRLGAELGVAVAVARQVHGAGVVWASAPQGAEGVVDLDADADVLISTQPGLAVAVRVADCVPILLADSGGSVVAAVHAGREGLLAGIVDAALDAVRTATDAPLEAWVGPHICGGCYEVPEAMARSFAERLGTDVTRTRWGTPGIDLGGAAARRLQARGVRVHDLARCTYADPALYSHRRDAALGRLAGIAWPAGRAASG